jgi:hypothetical protein
MANDVVLPDEYDRIHLDLAPFFALPRDEMHKRVEEVQDLPETYTLKIRRGRVSIDVRRSPDSSTRAMANKGTFTDSGQGRSSLGRYMASSGGLSVVRICSRCDGQCHIADKIRIFAPFLQYHQSLLETPS